MKHTWTWLVFPAQRCVCGTAEALVRSRIICNVIYGTKLLTSTYCVSFPCQDLNGNCHMIVSRKVDVVTLDVDSPKDQH